jgi:hypothetical protein
MDRNDLPNAFFCEKVLSGTGFSLCGFDLRQAKIKGTQAEACANEQRPSGCPAPTPRTGKRTHLVFFFAWLWLLARAAATITHSERLATNPGPHP